MQNYSDSKVQITAKIFFALFIYILNSSTKLNIPIRTSDSEQFSIKTHEEQMNHPLHFGLIDKSCVVLKKYFLYSFPLQIFRPSVVYPSYHVEVITLSIKFRQQLQQQYHFGLLQTHKNGSFWHSRPLGTGATYTSNIYSFQFLIKFRFSEKAAKVWSYSPLRLDATK